MNDAVYFADVELPFHVWVRESTGANGYRWVLRETPWPREGGSAEKLSDHEPSTGAPRDPA